MFRDSPSTGRNTRRTRHSRDRRAQNRTHTYRCTWDTEHAHIDTHHSPTIFYKLRIISLSFEKEYFLVSNVFVDVKAELAVLDGAVVESRALASET